MICLPLNRRRAGMLAILFLGASLVLGLSWQWMRLSADQWEQRCRDLRDRQDWTALARVSESWSRANPEQTEAWLFRAEAAEQENNWAAVVESLGRVPETDPRAINALVRKMGLEFEQLNRPFDSIETGKRLLKIDPRVLIAHKHLIFFYAVTLQHVAMQKQIREAIQLRRESPESYVYLAGSSWLTPEATYRHTTRWLEGNPDCELFLVARAVQVYRSNAKDVPSRAKEFEGIPPAEEMLRSYPQNTELLAYFLELAMNDGDLDRVQELLNAVPWESIEHDARFWRAKGWLADANGDLAASEQAHRQAFALDRYWWRVHFQIHDVARRLGHRESAEKFFDIYSVSRELAKTIMQMNDPTEAFNNPGFYNEMLKLAELVEDQEVVEALRQRISMRS